MIYLQLFFEFAKTGLFAIGGGMATIPFLQDMSARLGWFTLADLADMIAVSESTPGPIGINMATYVGYMTAGVLGSVVATLGEIFPALILVLILAGALAKFSTNKWLNAVFYGLRPASLGMIASAGVTVLTITLLRLPYDGAAPFSVLRWKECILAVVLFFAMNKWGKIHPIAWIGISAVIGIAVGLG